MCDILFPEIRATRIREEVMPVRRSNIEAERGRLGMAKSEISAELGVTVKTYNGYIGGGSIPSKVLEKLREMTGKSIDYLLGLTDQ
jgi:hypothetical protein